MKLYGTKINLDGSVEVVETEAEERPMSFRTTEKLLAFGFLTSIPKQGMEAELIATTRAEAIRLRVENIRMRLRNLENQAKELKGDLEAFLALEQP
jgi:hypothetical protein